MAEIPVVDTHGLEVLKKSAFIPDDTYPTRLGIRTKSSSYPSLTGEFDTVNVTYPSDAIEVYTFINAGATSSVLTVTYTDSTKSNLQSVVKT